MHLDPENPAIGTCPREGYEVIPHSKTDLDHERTFAVKARA